MFETTNQYIYVIYIYIYIRISYHTSISLSFDQPDHEIPAMVSEPIDINIE